MREIGSIANDLDVGAVIKCLFMYMTSPRDAHLGETGAT